MPVSIDTFTPWHTNDTLTLGDDDDGQTAALGATLEGTSDVPFIVDVSGQMLTKKDAITAQQTAGSVARTDLVSVRGEALVSSDDVMDLWLGAGVAASGDFRLVEVQEGWHRLIHGGRTRDGTGYDWSRGAYVPLQSRDPNRYRGALLLTGRTALRIPDSTLPWGFKPLAGVESQLAIGATGLSYARAYMGAEQTFDLARDAKLTLSGVGRLGSYACSDPWLTMPGGFINGHGRPSFAVGAELAVHDVKVGVRQELGTNGGDEANNRFWLSAPLPELTLP